MLKTTLLPETAAPELAPYMLTARAEIVAVLDGLRQAGITVTCFIEGSFLPAEARIQALLPQDDALVMVAVSDLEHDMLAAAGAITVVGFQDGVKIQFPAVANGAVALQGALGVRVSLPTQVLRLQRRMHGRVKPSRIRPLECMVRGEANLPTLQRYPVLDISVGGVALLGRTRDTYASGQRLVNCHFDFGADGEITTDLIVRNVERAEGSGGWRFGCTFVGIDDVALEKVCSHVERIDAHRRASLKNEP